MDSLVASPWPRNRALCVLAGLWSLIYGVLGLIGAGLFWALGMGQLVARAGAIEVWARGRFARWMVNKGWQGFTGGWTVFYWSPPGIGDLIHEREHVRQILRWGPLYYPVYAVASLACGYRRNFFEVKAYAAQRAAGYPNDA